jgi:phosphomannomutase
MSSLKFGTSGLRGLVTDLVGEPSRRWTAAFLTYLDSAGLGGARTVIVGRDLRSSSPRIAGDCLDAAAALGWKAVDCGALPTPALALAAMSEGASAIMVTGSHIPDDRNGLKFYTLGGEISKADEAWILGALEESEGSLTNGGQDIPTPSPSPQGGTGFANVAAKSPSPLRGGVTGGSDGPEGDPLASYILRYLDFFPSDTLSGMTVGVYQQSSVARDILAQVLEGIGAKIIPFERADTFIPVDTEAHRPEDLALLRRWSSEHPVDGIVSTDGDADRPLVADAAGEVVRGDLLGLLTARYLGLDTIVTPITSSSAIDTSGIAGAVIRTKVGSPFVIAGMEQASASGALAVVGFEANGGVLLGSDVRDYGRTLLALPTRDAVLPIVCALASARKAGRTLRQTVEALGAGHALADRLKEVGSDRSGPLLTRFGGDRAFADAFFVDQGKITGVNGLDGVRFALDDGSTVHFRASGNAPEFRCYVEAPTEARARDLLVWGLSKTAKEMGAG